MPEEKTLEQKIKEAGVNLKERYDKGLISEEQFRAKMEAAWDYIMGASPVETFAKKRDWVLAQADRGYNWMEGQLAELANTDPFYRQYSAADPAAFWGNLRSMALEALPPEEQQRLRWQAGEGRPEIQARKRAREEEEYQRLYAPPRYEPIFRETISGWEGTKSWEDWFERKYSSELGRFRATLPTEIPLTEQVEKSWAEHLKGRKPELKERWWAETAEERRWQARAFKPPIKTVAF